MLSSKTSRFAFYLITKLKNKLIRRDVRITVFSTNNHVNIF